jgi:serine/threonine protein kinase
MMTILERPAPITRTTRTIQVATRDVPQAESRMFREPEWSWRKAGDVGWWVVPRWRETLIGPTGLRIEEWRSRGALSIVKEGPHRVVYRVDLPQGAVFVKHFLVPDFRAILRQWFRRGKGRNEGLRAIGLAAIGVGTITPIALGEQRKRKFLFENYLITEAIPETVPLDEFVERVLPMMAEPRQSQVRRRLAAELGVFTARIHEAGFVHEDFHPGNLLVSLDGFERPRLTMIDLDALRVRRRLHWADAEANLALLNHYFWMRSSRTDRHRFLVAYLRGRASEPLDRAAFARGIEAATRTWAERLWRRWGRRCRGSNKYFETYRVPGAWGIASRELDAATVTELLRDPDAVFASSEVRILKASRTTTVAEAVLPVAGRPTPVIFKRFNRKKWLDPILSLFRPSRAWRAWQAGQHLASRAVPTPRNLAFLARTGPASPWILDRLLPRETYLITVKAEPSITLSDYLRVVLPHLPEERRRERIRTLTAALARVLRTLHERSLSHRDLKAANILIEDDMEAAEPRLSLIDLVGAHHRHPLPEHRRIQNLTRLQVSLADYPGRTRTDALRFLRVYSHGHLRGKDWKRLWRAIEQGSVRKAEKNQRHGRVLS